MRFVQAIMFVLIVRPLVSIVIGLNVHRAERLNLYRQAIIAANHNSHLDTLTLMAIWPLDRLYKVRPVAAADYFLTNRILAWLSLNIMHIIPIDRRRRSQESDPLAEMGEALERGETLILFPEGSRGEPEQLSRFKTGVARLVERYKDVPIVPIFIHGLGKSLPRGDFLLVPFFADVVVGEPIYWRGSVEATMQAYERTMTQLAQELKMPAWE